MMKSIVNAVMLVAVLAVAGCGAAPTPGAADQAVLAAAEEAPASLTVTVKALKLKFRPDQPTFVTTRYVAARGEERRMHAATFSFDTAARRVLPGSIVLDGQAPAGEALARAVEELQAVMETPVRP